MEDAREGGSLPNGLMSVSEVVQILKVTTETVRRYLRERKLQATKVRSVGLRTQ
jgi:excisionase family DNA binding protein